MAAETNDIEINHSYKVYCVEKSLFPHLSIISYHLFTLMLYHPKDFESNYDMCNQLIFDTIKDEYNY